MLESILLLPPWLGGLVAMTIATVLGLAVYLVSYRLISRQSRDDLKDPTSNLFRVVGMLVSLMLSLAFAEVIVELRAVENAIEREAVAIGDTFEDLRRFDEPATRDIRVTLLAYARAVVEDDWPALAKNRLGHRTNELKMRLTERVMSLEPKTPIQEKLWSRILTDVDAISGHRLIRLDSALAKPPVYVIVVIFGFLVTMAFFGAYRPRLSLMSLVSLYTVFVGLVLYLIVALSDPFHGALGIEPTTFEHLVEALRSGAG